MNETIELINILTLAASGVVCLATSFFCGKIAAYKEAIEKIEKLNEYEEYYGYRR